MFPVAESEQPFRIAIDVRPMIASHCGMTVHLASIIGLLRNANFDITLITNRPLQLDYAELHGLKTVIFGSSRGIIWEHQSLPRYLHDNDFDLYFTDANRGIPLRKNPRTRYILGLLDVIPYIYLLESLKPRATVRIRYPMFKTATISQLISVFRADAILTISQQSAVDIRRIFRRRNVMSHLIRLKEVSVAPPVEPKNQFVYIGGIELRKKIDRLIHAFALFAADHPDYQLVLIGSHYWYFDELIAQLGLTGRVVTTGYVDHDTKFRILGESHALVYPSLYEGYGLAIAEGFQAAVPVIAGRGGSQAEIGGDAVRYIDPLAAEEIAEAMREMIDPTVRAGWIARGQERLKALTDPQIETNLVSYFLDQGQLARQRSSKEPTHV